MHLHRRRIVATKQFIARLLLQIPESSPVFLLKIKNMGLIAIFTNMFDYDYIQGCQFFFSL